MNLIKILLNPGADFRQYHDAILMILQGLGNPYQFLTTSPGPFNYPPPVFLFLLPFGLFDLNFAWYLWVAMSMISLFISIYLLLKLSKRLSPISFFLAPILFWILFFPTKFTLGMGQINLFILLFITSAIYFYENKRKNFSVLFLALATSIKLSPGLLALCFIYRQDYKALFKYLALLLLLFLLPTILVSPDYQITYYTDVFFRAFGLAGKDIYYNQSIIAFLTRSFSGGSLINFVYYTFILLSLWYVRKFSGIRLWSYLVCLVLLINPLSWQHYFALAIIPLILLPPNPIAYVFLAWNWASPGMIPKELWSHQFFGTLILLFNFKIVWLSIIFFVYFFGLLCKGGYCF